MRRSLDSHIRDPSDTGKIVWDLDTVREFESRAPGQA
jgi:hypothetical protein